MKDRIREIMESMHMSQQTFAQFVELSPASLSSIFNGRTRPTLNVVEAIKNKIPTINTDWLLFGNGSMFNDESSMEENGSSDISPTETHYNTNDTSLDPSPPSSKVQQNGISIQPFGQRVKNTLTSDISKNIYKKERKITEIRVYFDDLTFETFIPSVKPSPR